MNRSSLSSPTFCPLHSHLCSRKTPGVHPWFFSPSHEHPNLQQVWEISLVPTHSSPALNPPHAGQLHQLPLWPRGPPCRSYCDLFQWCHIIPPHILMSSHFFWIPSLMSWPRSILTVSSPPSQPHFTQVTPGSLCFNHTCLHLHTQWALSWLRICLRLLLYLKAILPDLSMVGFFPPLISAWILLSDYHIQSTPPTQVTLPCLPLSP